MSSKIRIVLIHYESLERRPEDFIGTNSFEIDWCYLVG